MCGIQIIHFLIYPRYSQLTSQNHTVTTNNRKFHSASSFRFHKWILVFMSHTGMFTSKLLLPEITEFNLSGPKLFPNIWIEIWTHEVAFKCSWKYNSLYNYEVFQKLLEPFKFYRNNSYKNFSSKNLNLMIHVCHNYLKSFRNNISIVSL